MILERGKEEKEKNIGVRENIDLLPPVRTLTGDQTHNLTCPAWELSPRRLGAWDDSAPATELPGQGLLLLTAVLFGSSPVPEDLLKVQR